MNRIEYGYYFGEGRVQVTSQNVWQLIDEAVTEAEALDVHDVMVGPMKNEGEWTFGVNNPNAWATITYENSQWHWVSFGQSGDAKTLEDAMHHSKCVLIGETERPAPIDRLARVRAALDEVETVELVPWAIDDC